ncbi:MAG: hypothetical protein O2985_14675 [Proteobacteria bacterium]|nr:hypothetical protein [Pseudomonadota bacterium]
MSNRIQRTSVTFIKPFTLGRADEQLPPGTHIVETEEERLEGVSFPVYRRVSTTLTYAPRPGLTQTLTIDPAALAAALERDRLGD